MADDAPTIRGRQFFERAGTKLESRHPDWLFRHPVTAGLLWIVALLAVFVLVVALDAQWWLRAIVIVLGALPTLVATTAVLSQTPHSHLDYEQSILGHFFSRFVGLISAFVLWTGSVVISAAIAVELTDTAGTNQLRTWEDAVRILLVVVPFIVFVLWTVLVLRSTFFMVRLRGWRSAPTRHRIPSHFLAGSPRARQIVVGLAHPALLLVAGLLTSVLILALSVQNARLIA